MTDTKPFTSTVLVNANIDNSTELQLNVTCEFNKSIICPSCVVIWHKRNDQELHRMTLERKEPSLIVNQSGEYSVTVFGKQDRNIEIMPFLTKNVIVKGMIIQMYVYYTYIHIRTYVHVPTYNLLTGCMQLVNINLLLLFITCRLCNTF